MWIGSGCGWESTWVLCSGNRDSSKEMLFSNRDDVLVKTTRWETVGLFMRICQTSFILKLMGISEPLAKKREKVDLKGFFQFLKMECCFFFCFASSQKVLWSCFVIMLYDWVKQKRSTSFVDAVWSPWQPLLALEMLIAVKRISAAFVLSRMKTHPFASREEELKTK